jgi:hypothetical protein
LQMVMMMLMPLASLSAVCLFSAPCCRCGLMTAVGPCFCSAPMSESRACVQVLERLPKVHHAD